MATQIHGFGPNGELSPGAEAALDGLGGGGGASTLNDLTDVDTTGQTTGDVLKYNGTSWVADAASAGTVTSTDISDSTAVGRDVLTAADAATARTAIGAGTSSFDGAYSSLSGAPDLGDYVRVVEHGSTASTTRPAGATVVLWIGSVEPTNAVAGDQWDDASGSPAVYIEEPASEGTNGQVLTTDGAGGRAWTTVAGSGNVTAADVDSEAATDGYVLTADGAGGAAWEAAAGGGGSDPWTYYVASSEVTNSTTTLATATGLVIPSGLTAGTYQIDVQCLAKANAASAHKWTITKPTGGNLHFQWRIPTAATSVLQGSGIAAGGNSVATATGLLSWDWGGISFEAKGMLTVASSTSTSFGVQFAPDTASRTLTVMVGSYIAIRKIA